MEERTNLIDAGSIKEGWLPQASFGPHWMLFLPDGEATRRGQGVGRAHLRRDKYEELRIADCAKLRRSAK